MADKPNKQEPPKNQQPEEESAAAYALRKIREYRARGHGPKLRQHPPKKSSATAPADSMTP